MHLILVLRADEVPPQLVDVGKQRNNKSRQPALHCSGPHPGRVQARVEGRQPLQIVSHEPRAKTDVLQHQKLPHGVVWVAQSVRRTVELNPLEQTRCFAGLRHYSCQQNHPFLRLGGQICRVEVLANILQRAMHLVSGCRVSQITHRLVNSCYCALHRGIKIQKQQILFLLFLPSLIYWLNNHLVDF